MNDRSADQRLLIVDDDAMIGALVARIANRAGYQTMQVATSDDFLERVRAWGPTHIIVDLQMPVVDGLELLSQLASDQSTARIILISGAGGVLGSALRPLLTTGGHEVWTLVRRQPDRSRNEVYWNPEAGQLNLAGLPPFDGVIHLAGDNIGEGRWTDAKKRRVIDSRVLGTGLIAHTLASQPARPRVLLSASAVGFYGNCLDCCMREEDAPGQDFISDVCSLWENAAAPAQDAGIRTVFLRIGVVLTPRGGALQRLLTTSALGFPARFGAGDQYISWIGINDMVGAIHHALTCEALVGPVNIAAPQPATNAELLRTLAQVMGRPRLPPVPAVLLQSLYGQMASEVLLGGCRVSTDKLQQSGYRFRHADLATALGHLLGKPEPGNPTGALSS